MGEGEPKIVFARKTDMLLYHVYGVQKVPVERGNTKY